MPGPAKFVDTVHVRLLVDDFAAAFAFYDAVLPAVSGAVLAEGSAAGPYARWDTEADVQPALAILDRAVMSSLLPQVRPASGDGVIVVLRLADTDAAERVCAAAGGEVVMAAADQPAWGPEVRNAYVRDPAGNLIELQASPD